MRTAETAREMSKLRADKHTVLTLFLLSAVHDVGEFFLEFVDTSRSIHELDLARVKRMANVANINFEFRLGRPSRKFVAATAGYLSFDVLRMNVLFHNAIPTRYIAPLYTNGAKIKGVHCQRVQIGGVKIF